jgi:hypothetical protein
LPAQARLLVPAHGTENGLQTKIRLGKLKSQDMQAGGGYNKSIEGMASLKLSATTKGKLRASGFTGGAAHNHLPFYLHKELTDALGRMGESESLGRWSDFITPEETNFEALCRLSRLYMDGDGD